MICLASNESRRHSIRATLLTFWIVHCFVGCSPAEPFRGAKNILEAAQVSRSVNVHGLSNEGKINLLVYASEWPVHTFLEGLVLDAIVKEQNGLGDYALGRLRYANETREIRCLLDVVSRAAATGWKPSGTECLNETFAVVEGASRKSDWRESLDHRMKRIRSRLNVAPACEEANKVNKPSASNE